MVLFFLSWAYLFTVESLSLSSSLIGPNGALTSPDARFLGLAVRATLWACAAWARVLAACKKGQREDPVAVPLSVILLKVGAACQFAKADPTRVAGVRCLRWRAWSVTRACGWRGKLSLSLFLPSGASLARSRN